MSKIVSSIASFRGFLSLSIRLRNLDSLVPISTMHDCTGVTPAKTADSLKFDKASVEASA